MMMLIDGYVTAGSVPSVPNVQPLVYTRTQAATMTCSPPATGSEPSTSVPVTPAASSASDAPSSSDEIRPEPAAAPRAKRARRPAKKREPKPKKPKIRTYIRRRTEIEELTDEMKRLKKQMEYFAHRNEVLKEREALIERENTNKSMRKVLHSQRLSFASTLSMVTQFFRNNSTEPFDLPARLTKDPFDRQQQLLKMKNDRLQVGHHFMQQRHLRDMSTAEFCDRKKYEATNGDLVSTRFEITPLPGAGSVKAIIDALQFFVYNIEISLSEVVGDITVRENDDAKPGSPVAQHRLVATVADMVQTDTNNVAFAEYHPAGPPGSGEHEFGLMICDTVDEDELFPYRPQTRVRQDMTQITMVAMDQTKGGEPMMVMTRWWCLRIRKSDIYMPPFVVERIRDGVDKVEEAMLAAARRAAGAGGEGMIRSYPAAATFAASAPVSPAAPSGSDAPGSSDEVASTRSESASGSGADLPSKRTRRTIKKRDTKPKKPKIRTYVRRKTEIEELTDEMEKLKKQMKFYKSRNERLKQRGALVEREKMNQTMRKALHAQRLSFASTASLITQFFRDNVTEPFDLPARLGRDPMEREAALLRMRTDRLQVAHNFMVQRQHYKLTSEFYDRKRFEASNGDVVSLRFEIIPLPGACSVKTIIDALQNFVYNLEISISEAIGDISVRENDDPVPGSPVAQHRLVATIADLVQTDTNNVAFAEYRPAGPPGSGEKELGVMVCDTVDEDELFPYRPQQRVRQDMTVITYVTHEERENGEPIIVMTRWWCLRLRKSDIYIPPFVVDRIVSGVEKF
ncbi:uncharacterized protein IUM83_06645 [Phytophthora cinnamomi]|uniref:uncharacterized protein n=1 Tax=Phytophthora cinnamomi TaxID=4785 RepID=UPI00355958D2|nr:hypothetical protein IUM83_06645 [Phytophthora cinnamomi]